MPTSECSKSALEAFVGQGDRHRAFADLSALAQALQDLLVFWRVAIPGPASLHPPPPTASHLPGVQWPRPGPRRLSGA